MKRPYVLALALAVIACAERQEPQELAPSLEREVERLAGSGSLWPGFDPIAIPLAAYDGEKTYLFRHPDPPEGFVAAGEAEPGVYVYEGRYPAVASNTSAEIGGRPTGTLMLEGVAPHRGLTDLAAVAIHEAFHVYVRQRHQGWQANEGDLFLYPTGDPGLLAARRLETEALRRALGAPDSAASACWARRALALRGERFARTDAAFAAYERGSELNEGLATYVQLRAKGQDTVSLPDFGATEIRRRAYATGPALAFLLDRFEPGWPAALEAGDQQSLDGALSAALTAGGDGAAGGCDFSAAERAEAERVATRDVGAVLRERGEQRAAFDARPGWRVVIEAVEGRPLWPQGFDPLNIERVEGGTLHTRFLRLQNDDGQFEALDGGGADIEALTVGAGPHPLFNGVRRATIAGLAMPEVAAEGARVTIQAPGFTASFGNASVTRGSDTILVRMKPVK